MHRPRMPDADTRPGVTEIKVRENGPYRVEGPFRLIDVDGNEYDVGELGSVTVLCRCGASTTKPFCDKTHSKIGFAAAERAVAAQVSAGR